MTAAVIPVATPGTVDPGTLGQEQASNENRSRSSSARTYAQIQASRREEALRLTVRKRRSQVMQHGSRCLQQTMR